MIFAVCGCKCLYKDKTSVLHILKDEAKTFSKNDELERFHISSSLSTDSINHEPCHSAGSVLKYSKQKL